MARLSAKSMPITPVKSTKLYHLIVEQLKQLIQSGEYRPGDKLPPERELAQRLRVSRAPVREALVALELLDVVEGRVGDGWFVKRAPDSSLDVSSVEGRPPSDILQARVLVECAIAEQVAAHHDDELVVGLHQAVEAFADELRRGQLNGEADRSFHLLLARASGNAVFADLVAYLWDLQNGQFFRLVEGMTGNERPRLERYVREHRAVYEAVETGDAGRARDAMRIHLEGVAKDLLDS